MRGVKQFRIAWDPNAENVVTMLEEAVSAADNLLMGNQCYPKIR